jgi:hypothetical protein
MNRRRTNRFVIPEAAEGSLRLMQDVYIEQIGTDAVVVVTDAPLTRGEDLLLELPRESGARTIAQVEVASHTTVSSGGTRRYRVVLKLTRPLSPEDEPAMAGSLPRS